MVASGFGAAVVVVGAGVEVTVVSMYVVSGRSVLGRSVVAKTVGSTSLLPERSTEMSASVSALSPELSESGGPWYSSVASVAGASVASDGGAVAATVDGGAGGSVGESVAVSSVVACALGAMTSESVSRVK